jgi:sn-glycerol 3-phosphate transport system permease protein
VIVAFPVYITFVASTQTAEADRAERADVAAAGHNIVHSYKLALFGGQTEYGSTGAPVAPMMLVSLVSALVIAIGKIAISLLSALRWCTSASPAAPGVLDDLRHADAAGGGAHPADLQGRLRPRHAQHLRRADHAADRQSATATFLFRQFFLTVPDELVEAARIDGAGPMRFFKDVLLPLSTTSIAALFVIQFIYGWNQYLWPLLVTTDEDMYPVVMGIKRMISGGDAATEWNAVMATAMLAMIPPALVVMLMQKWFVKGLVDTEVPPEAPSAPPPEGEPAKPDGVCLPNRGHLNGCDFVAFGEKTYGSGAKAVKVIHGVSAEIPDGEFIVIVGPSGCGKSTLLRMVAGLEDITGGEIHIGGRIVNQLEPSSATSRWCSRTTRCTRT